MPEDPVGIVRLAAVDCQVRCAKNCVCVHSRTVMRAVDAACSLLQCFHCSRLHAQCKRYQGYPSLVVAHHK